MTNDDAGIQWALSGFGTGTPYPFHQFINCILGYAVCALYRVLPGFQWWHVVSVGCMLVGIFTYYYNLMDSFEQNSTHRGWRCAAIVFFSLTVWPYFIGRSSFTIVPAILAIGMTSFLLTSKKFHVIRIWLPMLTCLVASLFRDQTGLVMSCYLVLCLLFYWLNIEEKSRRVTELMVMSFILYMILMYICNSYSMQQYQNINSEEFVEYNSARVQYTDYPHIGYHENEEVYHSVGWDQELTSLVNQWCFLDERVNAEAFNTICAVHKERQEKNGIELWINLMRNDTVARFMTIIAFVQSVLIVLKLKKTNVRYLVLALGNFLGSILLIVYLCEKGRLPLRAYAVVLLPMLVINTFVIIGGIKWDKKRLDIVECLAIIIAIIACINLINFVYLNSDKNLILSRRQQSEAVSEYLINHEENIYISSMIDYWTNDINMIYKNEKPNNSIFWGGSTWLSDSYYKNLQMLGIDGKLSMQSFADDNVFFMTTYIDTYNREEIEYTGLNDFFTNLTDYGAIIIEKVDDIGDYASVWKIVFDDSIIDYSGELYIDGVGFYYSNGNREHGEVKIDGQIYELIESGKLIKVNNNQYMSIYGAMEESLPDL